MSSAINHRFKKINKPVPILHTYGDGTNSGWYDNECTWKNCHGKQIIAEIKYDYITGRKGRWSTASKFVCQEHLEKFIKNNPTAKEY